MPKLQTSKQASAERRAKQEAALVDGARVAEALDRYRRRMMVTKSEPPPDWQPTWLRDNLDRLPTRPVTVYSWTRTDGVDLAKQVRHELQMLDNPMADRRAVRALLWAYEQAAKAYADLA